MSTGKVNVSSFNIYRRSIEDLNDAVYAGIYMFNSTTINTPGSIDSGNAYGFCNTYSTDIPNSSSVGWVVQEAHCTSGLIYERKKINSTSSWSNWRLTGGTEDSSTKITSTQGTVYARIVGGMVVLTIAGIKPVANTWTTIVNAGNLPVKYRPVVNMALYGHSSGYGRQAMSIGISQQGQIQVSADTTPASADGNASCIYPAG